MIGLSGIPLEEADDHFLSDAGDVHGAPALAGPDLRDAHSARTLFVLLALPVPVKLDFDAAGVIDVDLLAFLADDRGGLRTLDRRASA